MSKENIDYRAIVERIAEMLHGSVTDIPLLTVTAQSYKDRFAKVEAERDALAAENAALKSAISHHAAGFTVCEACGEENVSGNDDVCRALNETPATDAFLREVKASGIDAASAELNQLAERSEKEAPIAAEHHRSAALYLQLFAAQLRQGGAA
ncbi:hypothetical protein BS412_15760 [Cronobacter turicensis]|uniref:Ead/Ea22-like family protein n=2 Tax=Cronobacter turicensis TaxID=413502 RepID=A0A2T7B4R8_9ENTR|nr:hypothetical protein [Cronobacter turicensis]PUX22009.1 hypothetical protein BS411_10785 [Cronobacter turicensis]PUX32370.1 hypothetical protein BS412_15760 [Cronobacter turicensis]